MHFIRRFPDYITGIVVLYVVTFALVLPFMCSNMIYSAYYSPATDSDGLIQEATDLNNARIKEAEKYFSTLSRSGNKAYYSELASRKKIDLAIAVVTTPRFVRGDLRLNYLTQVMAKLDSVIKNDQSFPNKALFICNVNAGPGNHTEALHMAEYFPINNKFSAMSPADTIMDPFDKEKEDYIFCMQEALYFSPTHILMIEDDAVPYDNMLSVVRRVMDGQRDPHLTANRDLTSHAWTYVKLFYPERWQGYSYSNEVSIIEELSISLIGGFIFLSAFHLQLAKCKNTRVHKHRPDEYFVFAIGFVYFGALINVIGRQYWLWFMSCISHYHTVIAPDCCSPAILYEANMAQDIITYLASINCHSKFPIDLAMAEFAFENDQYGYLIEPNLVKHIGMFSSVKSTVRYPQDFTF